MGEGLASQDTVGKRACCPKTVGEMGEGLASQDSGAMVLTGHSISILLQFELC